MYAVNRKISLQTFSTPSTNASHWDSGKQLLHHGNPSAIAMDFSPNMAVLRRLFCRICSWSAVGFSKALSEANFDIFAASGESTALVLLWKTCSRPIGVRVCPVAQFNFFSTACDPHAWTMIVFWKEDPERQPQLITPENGGEDETSSPSPPRFTFFEDPDVPVRPKPRGPPEQPRGLSPGPPDPPDPPGFPPRLPPAHPPAVGEREIKSLRSIA